MGIEETAKMNTERREKIKDREGRKGGAQNGKTGNGLGGRGMGKGGKERSPVECCVLVVSLNHVLASVFLFLPFFFFSLRQHSSSSHCSCRERANREEKLRGIRAIGEGRGENDKGAEKVISEHRGETVGMVVFRGAPRGKKGKARGWGTNGC